MKVVSSIILGSRANHDTFVIKLNNKTTRMIPSKQSGPAVKKSHINNFGNNVPIRRFYENVRFYESKL